VRRIALPDNVTVDPNGVWSSPLEVGSSKKWYAAGVGPVKDDDMILAKYGMKP
jgi:hypothetical protein